MLNLRFTADFPNEETSRWFVLSRIRAMVQRNEMTGLTKQQINAFLNYLSMEHRCAVLVDLELESGRFVKACKIESH